MYGSAARPGGIAHPPSSAQSSIDRTGRNPAEPEDYPNISSFRGGVQQCRPKVQSTVQLRRTFLRACTCSIQSTAWSAAVIDRSIDRQAAEQPARTAAFNAAAARSLPPFPDPSASPASDGFILFFSFFFSAGPSSSSVRGEKYRALLTGKGRVPPSFGARFPQQTKLRHHGQRGGAAA